jgi:hypothetical protein
VGYETALDVQLVVWTRIAADIAMKVAGRHVYIRVPYALRHPNSGTQNTVERRRGSRH